MLIIGLENTEQNLFAYYFAINSVDLVGRHSLVNERLSLLNFIN